MKRKLVPVLYACALVFSCGISPVKGETLIEVLNYAVDYSPEIASARAGVGASKEDIAIARAGQRPNVSASGSTSLTRTWVGRSSGVSRNDAASIGLQYRQNIYDGGATDARVEQAKLAAKSQGETVRQTTQRVLVEVVSAFSNHIRDEATVELRLSNVTLLKRQLGATRERFEVGELTRTDVAQAEARLAAAIAELEISRGNLAGSEANFIRHVGRKPSRLRSSSSYSHLIPVSVERGIQIALDEHPEILSAEYQLEASKEAARAAKAALSASLSVNGGVTESYSFTNSRLTSQVQIGASVEVPLYQGGQKYATIRKSQEELRRRTHQLDLARAVARARAASAWATYEAAIAQQSSVNAQVKAAQSALDGTREEAKVGQRTVLDVLDATQELLEARVQRLQVGRDKVSAAFALMAAIGRLDPQHLGIKSVNIDETDQGLADDTRLGIFENTE